MSGEEVLGATVDGDVLDGVTLFDRIDNVLTFGGFSIYGVLPVEVWSWSVGDEELRAVGVWSCIGH